MIKCTMSDGWPFHEISFPKRQLNASQKYVASGTLPITSVERFVELVKEDQNVKDEDKDKGCRGVEIDVSRVTDFSAAVRADAHPGSTAAFATLTPFSHRSQFKGAGYTIPDLSKWDVSNGETSRPWCHAAGRPTRSPRRARSSRARSSKAQRTSTAPIWRAGTARKTLRTWCDAWIRPLPTTSAILFRHSSARQKLSRSNSPSIQRRENHR